MPDDRDARLVLYRGKFAAEVWRDGRRQRRSLGTADRGLATARFAEYLRQAALNARPARATLAQIADAYIAARTPDIARPDTLRWRWVRPAAAFGPLYPEQVTQALCRSYAAKCRAPATARAGLGFVRQALNWAAREGWIGKAPYVWMPPPPPAKDRWLTRADPARH